MSEINYSIELFEATASLIDGAIQTQSPDKSETQIIDFSSGDHFRTAPESITNALVLDLGKRLLTLILDESGSMTWNDANGDRFTFFKRLLTKLDKTYPGQINVNLYGFGGALITPTTLIVGFNANTSNLEFDQILKNTFSDSVYDFSGVRVVRRSDHYPTTPADGVVVGEGIFEAIKDEGLTNGQRYYYGVWTFNKNDDYGKGKFISAFPSDRILPQGVHFAEAYSRVLTGISRDDYTQIIYNFVDGNGRIIYDSSGNGKHGFLGDQVVEENFWSGDASIGSFNEAGFKRNPIGVKFDGEFDIIETQIDDQITYGNNDLTISFWVYAYASSLSQWLIGTSKQTVTNEIGWTIVLSVSGEIVLDFTNLNDGFISTGVSIPFESWTATTVIIGSNISVYINGILHGTIDNPVDSTSTMDYLYIGAKPADSGNTWNGEDFFGILHNISISNTSRSASFIFDLYEKEVSAFSQSVLDDATKPIDNLQREVIIRWIVGENFDFENGRVKIVRKYKDTPNWIEDGDIIVDQTSQKGEFIFLDAFSFILNSDYIYRIFTFNSQNIPCSIKDARLLSVHIDAATDISGLLSPDPVTEETITAGNKKNMLEWTDPTDITWRGTEVFFGTHSYPTVDNNGQTDGISIADTKDGVFIHRIHGKTEEGGDLPLYNDTPYYYTIVAYNESHLYSEPKYLLAYPSEEFENIIFPPEEIKNLSIDIVNPESLSLRWNNPLVKSEVVHLFFGDIALIFTNIRDVFGIAIEDIADLKYEFFTEITNREITVPDEELGFDQTLPEAFNSNFTGAFPETPNSIEASAETIFTWAVPESGLLQGQLTHTQNTDILARRERYSMIVRAVYRIRNPDNNSIIFSFYTEPVSAVFQNPMRMTIVNKHNRTVTNPDKQSSVLFPCECPSQNNNFTGGGNGAYIGSNRPYVARVEVQYRGAALPDNHPITVEAFALTEKRLQDKPKRVVFQDGTYLSHVLTEEDNGRTFTKSYVDVEILSPTQPENIDLYASTTFGGFVVDGAQTISFVGAIFIEISATQPIPDGIDVGEQFANVWLANPDEPDDFSKRILVPDGTLVKWSIEKKRFGQDRPFYSTDTISEFLSGVYSSTTNGVARNVFFGPVNDLKSHEITVRCGEEDILQCCIAEEYTISAQVIYGDLSATDSENIFYICKHQAIHSNKRILVNADPTWRDTTGHNPEWITWADGIHMLKFQIAQNPVAAAANNLVLGANCFVSCVTLLNNDEPNIFFDLPEGHIVEVRGPGEILWDVSLDEDPYTGEVTLLDYKIISPEIADILGIDNVARIPIRGATTDFYIRKNAVVESDPKQKQLTISSDISAIVGGRFPNEWIGKCNDIGSCIPSHGTMWENVETVTASTTLLVNGKEITLVGGGGYEDGVPPIFAGFKEPLKIDIIEARTSAKRITLITDDSGNLTLPVEEAADGTSHITFVVEASFAGEPLPDGIPISIDISENNIVRLSTCTGSDDSCNVSVSGIVFFRAINDPYINPDDPDDPGSIAKRSFAYFTIDPIPPGTTIGIGSSSEATTATITANVDYDKRGDLKEEEA